MGRDEAVSDGGLARAFGEPRLARRRVAVTVLAILVGVVLSESLLFFGRLRVALWMHVATLLFCLFLLHRERNVAVVQIFALVPVFRLVNLGMPVFVELTVYWFPLVYGPLAPAVVLVDRLQPDLDVPFGLRRGLLLVPLAVPVGAALAAVEQQILRPESLVPAWNVPQLLLITVVMVCFVGFVEEYLFRGLLQRRLEAELGRWPGLLLASAVFGLMHSGYGVPAEILFAGVIGLVLGLLYDYLDSLVFVTIVHGVLNVFLLAVFPMRGWAFL